MILAGEQTSTAFPIKKGKLSVYAFSTKSCCVLEHMVEKGEDVGNFKYSQR